MWNKLEQELVCAAQEDRNQSENRIRVGKNVNKDGVWKLVKNFNSILLK